ncbi:hypothetical protein R3P38DRAFT_951213 [Favolaschia claudopus]|uniref:F-box domain-containing protein n=1 Tax=Favolaschia claudopus TaxID=2862362 RepID=A0AAW0BNJ0_9AGAR
MLPLPPVWDIPRHLLPFYKANVCPTPSEARQIGGLIADFKGGIMGGYNTEHVPQLRELLRLSKSIVMGFRQLPVEILEEIFAWVAAGSKPCTLPQSAMAYQHPSLILPRVSSRWRTVAMQSALWNRIELQIDPASYPRALHQLQVVLAQRSQRLLDIRVQDALDDNGVTSTRSLHNMVVPYSNLISELCLQLATVAVEEFLCLAANSFPALKKLQLFVYHVNCSRWLICRPEQEASTSEALSRVTPVLSHLLVNASCIRGTICHCMLLPTSIGINFGQLRELKLMVNIPHHSFLRVLRLCVCLETLALILVSVESDDPEQEEMDESPTTLSSLRTLTIKCYWSEAAYDFYGRLRAPALQHFTHVSWVDGSGYDGQALLRFLEHSECRLISLSLDRIKPLGRVELHKILETQPKLERLQLSECKGSFWDALLRPRAVLIPRLKHFTCKVLPAQHLDCAIKFVNSRCAPQQDAVALETVVLTTGFTSEVADLPKKSPGRILQFAAEVWKVFGVKVVSKRCSETVLSWYERYGDDAQGDPDEEQQEWLKIVDGLGRPA